jgi:hypothetical protein
MPYDPVRDDPTRLPFPEWLAEVAAEAAEREHTRRVRLATALTLLVAGLAVMAWGLACS